LSISAQQGYLIPAARHRIETVVANSRFIATAAHVTQVEQVKAFLQDLRHEMPDASHHVYAFRIGYGNSTIEGMSDDGEPSGTAGPPVLAVLRGTAIGDVIVTVTRYFGGTKLGTGGLVRAYTEAAQTVLSTLPTEAKIEKILLGIELSYPWYEQIKRLIAAHEGIVQDTTFESDITLIVQFPAANRNAFTDALRELSAGRISPVILSE
jgi:uncharacterized YigZ family protein